MAASICPCCQRALPKPKAAKLEPVADTRVLPVDQAIAYLKKIALREDTRFFLAHCPDMPADIRARAEQLLAELEARASKGSDAKLLNQLRDQARTVRPWARYDCGVPEHNHYCSVNAERCKADRARVWAPLPSARRNENNTLEPAA